MSNFDDFDLDIKKVSESTSTPKPASVTVTISIFGNCVSADSPTTGGTGMCCNTNNATCPGRKEARCI